MHKINLFVAIWKHYHKHITKLLKVSSCFFLGTRFIFILDVKKIPARFKLIVKKIMKFIFRINNQKMILNFQQFFVID